MPMIINESVNFCVNRFLEHLSGTFSDELIQRAPIIKLLSKRKNFGIDVSVHWR